MATAAAIYRVVHHSVILEFAVAIYRTVLAQQRGAGPGGEPARITCGTGKIVDAKQTRLQILNRMLAEHMMRGQAAMLMARYPSALALRFRAAISFPAKSGPHFRRPLDLKCRPSVQTMLTLFRSALVDYLSFGLKPRSDGCGAFPPVNPVLFGTGFALGLAKDGG